MSNAKYTPGPWRARWQDPIDVDDYARIAIETAPDAGDIAGIHHATRGEDEANARLIASSPDLLTAARIGLKLGEIAVRLGLSGFSKRDEDAIIRHHVDLKVIRAAIEKATGGN